MTTPENSVEIPWLTYISASKSTQNPRFLSGSATEDYFSLENRCGFDPGGVPIGLSFLTGESVGSDGRSGSGLIRCVDGRTATEEEFAVGKLQAPSNGASARFPFRKSEFLQRDLPTSHV